MADEDNGVRRSLRHMDADQLKILLKEQLTAYMNDVNNLEHVLSKDTNDYTKADWQKAKRLVAPDCKRLISIDETHSALKELKTTHEEFNKLRAEAENCRHEMACRVDKHAAEHLEGATQNFTKFVSHVRSKFESLQQCIEGEADAGKLQTISSALEADSVHALELYSILQNLADEIDSDTRRTMDRLEHDFTHLQTLVTTKLNNQSNVTVKEQHKTSHKGSKAHSVLTCNTKTSTSSMLAKAEADTARRQAELDAQLKQNEIAREQEMLDLEQAKKRIELAERKRNAEQERLKQLVEIDRNKLRALRISASSSAGSNKSDLLSVTKAPKHQIKPESECTCHSELSKTEILAKTLSQSIAVSRLPIAEPPIFSGNPLEYRDWEVAFSTLVESKGVSEREKIHYLKRYVAGEAREAISGHFTLSSDLDYSRAKQTLKRRYGDDFTVAEAFRKKLDAWPKISNRDTGGLRKFSDFLNQCNAAMDVIPELGVLNDNRENLKMMNKLPERYADRWSRIVTNSRKQEGRYPLFAKFVEFVQYETDVACDPVTSQRASLITSKPEILDRPSKRKASTALATASQMTNGNNAVHKRCVHCSTNTHETADCRRLAAKTQAERNAFVKNNHLCFGCLQTGHMSKKCTARATCSKCSKRHPTSLHINKSDVEATSTKANPSEDHLNKTNSQAEIPNVTSHAVVGYNSRTFSSSMIVPVWVSHKDNPTHEILVYALLDTQSDTTFILDQTCESLQCPMEPASLKLMTMTSQQNVKCNRVSDLSVRSLKHGQKIKLPMSYTRQYIPIDKSHIPTPSKAKAWPHLQRISYYLSETLDCEIGLLIGYNCPQALAPVETIVAPGNNPFAIRTELGWSIVGALDLRESADAFGVAHRVMSQEVNVGKHKHAIAFQCKTRTVEPRCDPSKFVKLLETDFEDTRDDKEVSQKDLRFLAIMSSSVRQDADGHISMPLPLESRPEFPDSRHMAKRRLELLKRKFDRDPVYKMQYQAFMSELLKLGHAERVEQNDCNSHKWYIPHFGVFHPKKPDRIRVVFDCAARYQECCLNDHLLKGPDQLNGLIGILLRFRAEPVAVTCDIERMFHQFRVHEEDRDYLRFLWYNKDSTDMVDYRMTVHLFGASSSPGCATFGLRQLAELHKQRWPQAAEFIKSSFYVDDGLISVRSKDEAIQLVKQSIDLCAQGGVRLHKFLSNERDVLTSVPMTERAKEIQNVDLSLEDLPTERTLGVQWFVEDDEFGFKLHLSDRPATRRGVLSGVASVYDPLGFVAPFIMKGKSILQLACKEKVEWDEKLPVKLAEQWSSWLRQAEDLKHVRIPRCFKPSLEWTPTEIHYFSDASTSGYGVCAYLKSVDLSGNIHCSFLIGKSRVAPLKLVSIPRLELQAAVVAVRLSRLVRRELILESNVTEFFWSDSKVVLAYIQNDVRKFKVYVANRIQEIRDCTSLDQWRYVPSEHNPADIASRGLSAIDLVNSSWLNGPEFLRHDDKIPMLDELSLDPDDSEVRSNCLLTSTATEPQQYELLRRVDRFSRLIDAVGDIASLFRVVARWRRSCGQSSIWQESSYIELRSKALKLLVKLKQQESFSQELHALLNGETLGNRSPLSQLDVFVDSEGLLRIGGRLKHSSLSIAEKHPLILPRRSHLTTLVIDYYHREIGHGGRTSTMNKIRMNGYWILNLNQAVSSYIHSCVICRRLRGKASVQKMADLPSERTEPMPPFLVCGCDVFGPFMVKERRKELKLYGLLFTCMASRAVHLEVLDELSSDAFINAFRCLIALRGPVSTLFCDRGTNFVGAQSELAQGYREMVEPLQMALQPHQCEFKFNTPGSSHMGGVWERQVRTVRNVLRGILIEKRPTLDCTSLRTLFHEIAAIINSRPLTVDTLNDPLSLRPITPNHLLTQKSDVILSPPGDFDIADVYARKRWRKVQYLADSFWKRWQQEYLQSLQYRQKWHTVKQNLRTGDIVMVQDSNTLRGEWKLARVIQVHPGRDNLVRKLTLQLGAQSPDKKPITIDRPVAKVKLLVKAD